MFREGLRFSFTRKCCTHVAVFSLISDGIDLSRDVGNQSPNLHKSCARVFILYLYEILQACAFRDSYEKFKKAGAEVVGISGDNTASHKVKHRIFTAKFSCLLSTINQCIA